jgi:hypothetical protein
MLPKMNPQKGGNTREEWKIHWLKLLHENSSHVSRRLVDLDDILPLTRSTPLSIIVLRVLLWWPTVWHLISCVLLLLLLLLLSPLTLLLSLLMCLLLLLLASLLHSLLLVGLLLLLRHTLCRLTLHVRNRNFKWRRGFVSAFHRTAQHALVELG